MKIGFWAFNTYLLLLTGLMAGCQTDPKKKELSTFRMHIETNPDSTGKSSPVTIGRSEPFPVNVENVPFITESHVENAAVIDALGGFQIMVQLNRQGTWLLEQYSLASRDKRAAIFSNFGSPRWLAAPKLSRKISDGVLVFTPDCTREEAERIVRGVNNLVKQIKKGNR
ncbi:MAG TPA: hypothetical protein VJ063_08025 [Verrucomicrobiae bacterium]|nr:hypothetical protein [Verrucomicrobiae bacterium]